MMANEIEAGEVSRLLYIPIWVTACPIARVATDPVMFILTSLGSRLTVE